MAAEFFRLALEDVFLPPVDPFCNVMDLSRLFGDVISTRDAACCDDRPSFDLILMGGCLSPPSLLKDNGPASCPLALSPDEPTSREGRGPSAADQGFSFLPLNTPVGNKKQAS